MRFDRDPLLENNGIHVVLGSLMDPEYLRIGTALAEINYVDLYMSQLYDVS